MKWETVKKRRTPITWGMLVLFIGLLYSTGIMQLVWIQGINTDLVSEAEAEVSHAKIMSDVNSIVTAINKKADTAAVSKARYEINQIDGELRFNKELTEEEKEFKRGRKKVLNDQIECINTGKENCI